MIGFAVGNVLIGRYVDRLGIIIPIIAAALSMGVGFAAAAAVGNIWVFALLQGVFIGIGTAASFGPLIADVSHWFIKRRGVAVALCASGNYVGGAIWPLVVQAMMDAGGWRITYVVIGILVVVTMVPLALLLRRSPSICDDFPVETADPSPPKENNQFNANTVSGAFVYCWDCLLRRNVNAAGPYCRLLCRPWLRCSARRRNAFANACRRCDHSRHISGLLRTLSEVFVL